MSELTQKSLQVPLLLLMIVPSLLHFLPPPIAVTLQSIHHESYVWYVLLIEAVSRRDAEDCGDSSRSIKRSRSTVRLTYFTKPTAFFIANELLTTSEIHTAPKKSGVLN